MTSKVEHQKKLNVFQIYWLAARPKTLPAAAAPVVTGAAAAFARGNFHPLPALATLMAALLLQIGANIANDVFDFHKGADTAHRLGPLRVTQAGLWSPAQTLAAMWLTFGLAALLGIYLAWVGGWPVVGMGLAAIAAAILYTGGPVPLGYYGLGDLFVFIFFGPVAEIGTYYILAHSVSPLSIWASIPVGLLIVNILVVNNLRDIETDQAARKITLAVILGAKGARWQYNLLLVIAYLIPLGLFLSHLASIFGLASWLSAFLAIPLAKKVWTGAGRPLNLALAQTGQLALIFAILFGAGLVLGKFLGI